MAKRKIQIIVMDVTNHDLQSELKGAKPREEYKNFQIDTETLDVWDLEGTVGEMIKRVLSEEEPKF